MGSGDLERPDGVRDILYRLSRLLRSGGCAGLTRDFYQPLAVILIFYSLVCLLLPVEISSFTKLLNCWPTSVTNGTTIQHCAW